MTAVSPVGFEDCSMGMSRHSSQQTATKTLTLQHYFSQLVNKLTTTTTTTQTICEYALKLT